MGLISHTVALYSASAADSSSAVVTVASSASLACRWALLTLWWFALLPSPIPKEGDQKRLLVTVWNGAVGTR